MSDRQWENMSDTDFEAMLESTVSELPPEDIVEEVTPWKGFAHGGARTGGSEPALFWR